MAQQDIECLILSKMMLLKHDIVVKYYTLTWFTDFCETINTYMRSIHDRAVSNIGIFF